MLSGLLYISGCTPKDQEQTQSITESTNDSSASGNYEIIADTITYSVLLQNDDPFNKWKENALKNLDRDKFTHYLFESVYNGELEAFDFRTNEKLSVEEIKALEEKEEFSRDKIARAQFEEIWYLDTQQHKMRKEVYSIMIAYVVHNDQGKIRGYKPAFKVYLKP